MLQDPKSRLVETRGMVSEAASDGPARIGAELREARERHGWELSAVAANLRIRLPYLEALEEGRAADLPGPAYAQGFLRSYASLVGLDPDEMSRRFRAQAGPATRRTELAFPAPVPQRGVPAGAVVLLGVLLAAGAYVGWYRWSGDQHAAVQTVPPAPERLANGAPVAAPSPQVASILPATSAPSPLPPAAVPAPAPVGGSAAAAAGGGVAGGQGAANEGTASVAAPAATASGLAAAAPVAAPAAPAVDPNQVVLRVSAPAWVMVRPARGPALINRTLRPGEDWTAPPGERLSLSTGNASALQISVGGTAVAPLAGTSRRDVSLDPEALRAGRVQAAPPPAPRPKPVAKPRPPSTDDSADALNARQLASTPH